MDPAAGDPGVCHSDLSVVNVDRPRPVPMLLGHEASGRIAELGPGVDDLRLGQKVVPTVDVPEYVALWEAGRLPVERLVSAYLDLDDVNRAMDDLATGRAMRQVIKL